MCSASVSRGLIVQILTFSARNYRLPRSWQQFTTIDPRTGSPFTGPRCPTGNQFTIDNSDLVQGPIPLTGPGLALGEQVIQFECSPNCTADNYTVIPSSVVYARQMAVYLEEQARTGGYAKMPDGKPVPELVARMGVYLHWVADRASHWYCTDAPGSGVTAVPKRAGNTSHYDLFLYLDPNACNFVR